MYFAPRFSGIQSELETISPTIVLLAMVDAKSGLIFQVSGLEFPAPTET